MLIIVNNRKLCDFAEYWHKAADRLIRDTSIETPVSLIVHSRREVNTYLREGQYFFSDIRKEGIVLYELDDEPLPEPEPLSEEDRLRFAKEHFEQRFAEASAFLGTAEFQRGKSERIGDAWGNLSAFSLHQSLEQAYSCVLLTLTNYGHHRTTSSFCAHSQRSRTVVWLKPFRAISTRNELVQHSERSLCEGALFEALRDQR